MADKKQSEGIIMERDLFKKQKLPFYTSTYEAGEMNILEVRKELDSEQQFLSFSRGLVSFMERLGVLSEEQVPAEALIELFKKQKVSISKYGLIRNWFGQEKNPQRVNLFRICFALQLNPGEAHELLTSVAFENTFNFRDPQEIIYFFCLEYRQPYLRACELFEEYQELTKVEEEGQAGPGKPTRVYEEQVRELHHSEDELLAYLVANHADFGGFSRTTRRNYEELKACALEKLKKIVQSQQMIVAEGRSKMPSLKKEPLDQAGKELDKDDPNCYRFSFTNETLLHDMVAGIYYLEQKRGGEESELKRFNVEQLPQALADVTENLPSEQLFSAYDKGDKEIHRKAILLLKFFDFFIDLDEDFDDPLEEFCSEANDLLDECGMGCLYPHNRFDYVLLKAAADPDPIVAFNDLLASFF